MPQASPGLRALMQKWFGGIGAEGPEALLRSRGYSFTQDGFIRTPTPAHTVSDVEWTLIAFLTDEWDYAIDAQWSMPSSQCYAARWEGDE